MTDTLTLTSTRERSRAEMLKARREVEEHFARLGHTYRHGKWHRRIEHGMLKPLLKLGLQATGLYGRGVRNALNPEITRVRMEFSELPAAFDGFEILHLSDLHIDGAYPLHSALAPVLEKMEPDVCVITGDYRFEDRGTCAEIYPRMETVLRSISARHGVFGILGNHDAAEIALRLEEMGVQMLMNESAEIRQGGSSIWIAGVDDPFDYGCDDLPAAMENVPADAFKVLLAHAPELFAEAAEYDIDLYLSGHTHAGQIRLPLVGSIRHNADCPREYAHGHWRHNGMQGYTSAGVGCSCLPIRYNCRPEIVVIELGRRRND